MRTTIDVSDELFRAAKVEAINRGITLRELITEALEKEILSPSLGAKSAVRLHQGVISSEAKGTFIISEDTIQGLELEDDLHRSGLL